MAKTAVGPALGTLGEGLAVLVENAHKAAEGQDTHTAAQGLRVLRSNAPYLGLWYARAAVDHAGLHALQENLSPGYLGKMRQRAAKEWGQDYWWKPARADLIARPTWAALWESDAMRQDQFDRLLSRQEQLMELFLEESDPATWSGAGIAPAAMDKATRGDRYWCKKNAVASLSLVQRIGALVVAVRQQPEDPPGGAGPAGGAPLGEDDELDAEVAAAERDAERLLKRVQSKAKAPQQ